jgi:hypothetical protein
MASQPRVNFGAQGHLPLPPGAQPFGLVFEASTAQGNQLSALGNATLQQNAPGACAIWGATGDSDSASGFNAQVYVTRDGVQRQLASIASPGGNVVGTASRPFYFQAAEILEPGDLVTVEISNLDPVNPADVQVVLWAGVVSTE